MSDLSEAARAAAADALYARLVEQRLDQIQRLIEERGQGAYFGEPISTADHMLQTAVLAERAGHPPATVAAGLLHDIGHLLHDEGEDIADHGVDTAHEDIGADWLADLFGPDVVQPIRLHVAAKRYLCATDPRYFNRLSPASVLSLDLQGGPMSANEVAAFEADPHGPAALVLRRFDEAAKVPGTEVPAFAAFRPMLAALARPAVMSGQGG